MAHDVFLSYSTLDRTTAEAVRAGLEAQGIRCWIAQRDVLPGAEYGQQIIEAINSCKTLVLVFSSHANDSPHVRREVERALSHGKIVIPFRIEDVLPTNAMEYCLV